MVHIMWNRSAGTLVKDSERGNKKFRDVGMLAGYAMKAADDYVTCEIPEDTQFTSDMVDTDEKGSNITEKLSGGYLL